VKRRIPLVLSIALMALPVASSGNQTMAWCRGDQKSSTHPPVEPPSLRSPKVCRAHVSLTQHAVVVPTPGYHHLGATTAGGWSGVLARFEVVDSQVRPGTFDFLAARVMAKADTGKGIAWLEAGWTETGWGGDGRQRIYTYDTNGDAWSFYDEYDIKPGDRIWIYLQTEQDGPTPAWQAWLWWGDEWHLLTSQALPLTGSARIEQYAEVHTDDPFEVPSLHVDNVALKAGPRGALRPWDASVPTGAGVSNGPYCLDWTDKYSTWSAGTCP